ncbi:MAG TPA: sulfatase [Polyangiales bacterium]|nr:sulfatase [Polyangiales bacterium]
MRGRSAGYGSVLFLLLSGFTSDPGLQRLGPDHAGSPALEPDKADASCNLQRGGRLRLEGEVRTTLPRCPTQVISARVAAGCTLQVGLANLDPSEPLQFQIAIKRGASFVDEPAHQLDPGARWSDVQLALETQPTVQQIRFSVSGKNPQLGVFSRPTVSCPAAKQGWNVLLISLDTLRADRLGVYGNPNELTPNLDRFAQQGATFLQAYAQYPNTYGSHAALFTGQYPTQIGMVGAKGHALGPRQATLASELAARGYVTVAFTEDAFVGSAFGFDRGFDRYSDGDPTLHKLQGYASTTFKRATDWLKQRPAAPFFMFLHTYQVHTPYAPSDEAREHLRSLPGGDYHGSVGDHFDGLGATAYNIRRSTLSPEDLQHISWLYDAEVWSLDQLVGQLFGTLRELELLDSTLIVVVADHGDEFGEHEYLAHGETLHHQVLHVPLIFRAPGLVPDGLLVNSVVGLLDVPATIGDLLGMSPFLPNTSGRSHAAWMRAEPPLPAQPVWSELTENSTICPEGQKNGFRTCPYDGVVARDRDYAYFNIGAKDQELLFDRRADVAETRDLAADRPEITARYRKLAQARLRGSTKRAPRTQAQVDMSTQSKLRALGYTR